MFSNWKLIWWRPIDALRSNRNLRLTADTEYFRNARDCRSAAISHITQCAELHRQRNTEITWEKMFNDPTGIAGAPTPTVRIQLYFLWLIVCEISRTNSNNRDNWQLYTTYCVHAAVPLSALLQLRSLIQLFSNLRPCVQCSHCSMHLPLFAVCAAPPHHLFRLFSVVAEVKCLHRATVSVSGSVGSWRNAHLTPPKGNDRGVNLLNSLPAFVLFPFHAIASHRAHRLPIAWNGILPQNIFRKCIIPLDEDRDEEKCRVDWITWHNFTGIRFKWKSVVGSW